MTAEADISQRKVCFEGRIWDLHIHSNQCYSCTDEELKKLSIDEYVNRLLEVLNEHDDLDMISFTDHNHISVELYEAFYKTNSRIALLPGVEIDVALEKNAKSKHLIVYFDAMNDMDKLRDLAEKLNKFLADHNVGSGNTKKPIYIHYLLDELVTLNVHFVLSPHAMKQGDRSFDSDWHSMPEEERSVEIKKYLDQFFCFWESSGSSEIAHAIDFLKLMDSNELISVISFSDSKDFKKLREYLDHPCQYFNALPNFNGLKLAGSEITRITREKTGVEASELGSYIGSVTFDNQTIEFCPRLNAIIGGRGSGKSLLLDSIARGIKPDTGDLTPDRSNFIAKQSVRIKTMSGTDIPAEQFVFDYFNQNYIASLFNKSGKDFNDAVEKQFEEAFLKVKPIDKESIKRDNEERFSGLMESLEEEAPENIVGFVEKYTIDVKDSLDMDIGKKKSKATVADAKLAKFEYQDTINNVRTAIVSKLPSTVANNKRVVKSIVDLQTTIIEEGFAAKEAYFEESYFQNKFVDLFIEKKNSISETQKQRAQQIKLFEETFRQKSLNIKKRVALVRVLVSMSYDFETHYEESDFADGEAEKSFKFMRELVIEHPLNFMVRVINSHMLSITGVGQCTIDNLWQFIEAFCFKEDGYKKSSDWNDLYDELSGFNLQYEEKSSICFAGRDGVYRDIRTLSPGTQTNILLEYIVHKKTKRPLLIDQPEDNVDNQTIYKKIRNWFIRLKDSRQVIVVTHDANIVINADAEDVIIAEQPRPGEFSYSYGALEYADVIDKASLILDGGKDAVKRRLVKYGD
ncbi:hypothetical protein [Lancefieldella parvula]|uniref:hypothetical protein n=1 Tax=Lancefieldella parvula TaxID=1382 RepID=UPI00288A1D07|nr:hypothetical protein [Lancefieldella parvula]